MPAFFKCPICKEDGRFGFTVVNGGIYYYHDKANGDLCRHWHGNNDKDYATELEFFNDAVVPDVPNTEADRIWIEARRADITGEQAKAEKLYKKWQELAEA